MKRLFLLLVFYTNLLFSQFNIPFQNPKTPEEFQFEKYGNLDVANYTGRPSITIPLYTIDYGDIKIPLDISYTSNGIRVDEEASSFGLGWYFGTGMITQIVNDKDDLKYQRVLMKPQYLWASSIGYPIYPNPDWFVANGQNYSLTNSTTTRVERTPSQPDLNKYFITRLRSEGSFDNLAVYYDTDMKNYYYSLNENLSNDDISEDIFQANFFGHSLIFVIDVNSIKVLNEKGYKIEKFFDNENSYDKIKWIITAPDGISYFFENEMRTYNMPVGYDTQSPNFESSGTGYKTFVEVNPNLNYFNYAKSNSRTWKIKKIKDTKGNEVVFNYDDLQPIYSNSGGSGKCDFINIETISTTPRNTGLWTDTGTSLNYDGPNITPSETGDPFSTVGKYIRADKFDGALLYQKKSILKEIIFGNAKIEFVNTNRLDIPFDKKVDAINVTYNNNIIKSINFYYDYFNSSSTEDIQKRLKLSSVNLGEKPYVFTYNSIDLPNKDSNSSDYWGFYNGMPNTSAINNPFRLYKDASSIPSWAKYFLPLLESKANKSAHPEYCKAGILEKITYPTGGSTELKYELNEFDNYFFPNYDNKIGLTEDNNYQVDYEQTNSKGFGLRISQVIDRDNNDEIINKKTYKYFGGKHIPSYLAYNDIDYYKSISYPYTQSLPEGSNIAYYYKRTFQGPKITSYNSSIYQSSVLGNGNFVGYDRVEIKEEGSNNTNNGNVVYSYSNSPDVNSRIKFGVAGGIVGLGVGLPAYFCDYFGESIRSTDLDNGLSLKEEVYDKNNNLLKKAEFGYNYNVYTTSSKYNVKPYTLPGRYGYIVQSGQEISYSEHLFLYYPQKFSKTYKTHEKITEFFPSGSKWTMTNYVYNNNNLLIEKETRDQFGSIYQKESIGYGYSPILEQKNILNLVTNKSLIENNTISKREDYIFETINFPSLKRVEIHHRGNNTQDFVQTVFMDLYDDKGNVLEFHQEDGLYTCIVWGYNKTLPILKIENIRYSDIESHISALVSSSNQSDTSGLFGQITSVRTTLGSLFPKAQITSYTHIPLVGIKTITDTKGYTYTYNYDSYNRLINVKDDNGNIVSENQYHFKP